MPAPINQFKQQLLAGTRTVGLWMGFCDPYVAELVGKSGFDWVVIDGEHTPNDIPLLTRQLQVLDPLPTSAIVRLPVGDVNLIKQVLDGGAQTLLIPMVNTAEQAKQLVAAMRYAPEGIRGMGGALARSTNFGRDADYVATANDQMCLLVQIETRQGLENLDEILAVDGVDGLFVGPADLSAEMGYPGLPDAPEMQALISETLGRIRDGGKAAGIIDFSEDAVTRHYASGAQYVAVGADITFLSRGLRDLATRWQDQVSTFD